MRSRQSYLLYGVDQPNDTLVIIYSYSVLIIAVVTRDIDPLAQLEVNPPTVMCDSVSVTFTTNGDTQCQLNNGSFTDCKSPYHRSGLHGGKHTITIKTSDGLNQESVSFTVPGSLNKCVYIYVNNCCTVAF